MGIKRYFEEFKIGDKEISRGRQLDISDIRMYGACTNINYRIYSDPQYCAAFEEIRRPIMPTSLVLNVIDSFFAESVSPEDVETLHYGYDDVKFLEPVYPGDCIYSTFEVVDMNVRNEEFGILTLHAHTYNQHGREVVFHVDKLYVERVPKDKQ